MVRWYYPSIFDELEDMRKYMESLSRQMYDTSPMVLLPGPAESTTKMLPVQRAGLRVDVADTDREVVVTADMIPGVSKKDITLILISPRALEISCERRDENQEEKEGYFMRERRFGCMTRIIPLPGQFRKTDPAPPSRTGCLKCTLKNPNRRQKEKFRSTENCGETGKGPHGNKFCLN